MSNKSSHTEACKILEVNRECCEIRLDQVALEAPLEIRLIHPKQAIKAKALSVTMRTPGDDKALALGFLWSEGIIKSIYDIDLDSIISAKEESTITLTLSDEVKFDWSQLQRNFYTSSSCGVCGKTAIESVYQQSSYQMPLGNWKIRSEILHDLPSKLMTAQEGFHQTGGLHAAGIFEANGELLLLKEDVGRHNALDKVIGTMLEHGKLPLASKILLLSGRASFELIQKAAMAGIQLVAAVGAPSSLAVQLAEEMGITLIGFLKDQRFNIYSCASRIN